MSDDTIIKTADEPEIPEFTRRDDEVVVGDEVVAKLEGDELKIKRGFGKYRDQIEAVLAPVSTGDAGSDDIEIESPEPAAAPAPTPVQIVVQKDKEGIVEEARVESEKYAADVADDAAFAKKNGCPQPPAKHPQFGDKTPKYVEWLRTYRPDKYAAKYGIERQDQRVPIYGEDGEVIRHETKDIGQRKTHLSEKIERDPTLDQSMSWDA